MSEIKTIVLLGKPGAGKGTQAERLGLALHWRKCSTGDYFRNLARRENDLGKRVVRGLSTAGLLPDFFITQLLVTEMMSAGSRGLVFDGFARSRTQAQEMHGVFSWFERPYLAINLQVSDKTMIDRISERSQREHRIDSDTSEKIARRLEDYHEKSAPALGLFEKAKVLRQVDGEQHPDAVHQAILALL